MKIASIDVGIKNLAICVLNINDNNFEIEKWDVINLSNEPKCSFCNELAKFSKNEQFYCNKHGKKSEYKIPNINLLTLEKKSKKNLIEICNKNNIAGTEKMLKTKIIETINNSYGLEYLIQIEKINANAINLVDIGKSIKTKLILNEIDRVIIENQIGPLANRMKCLQAMITQFFIDNNVETIEYISAINKLAYFTNKVTEYKERKKLSVEITRSFIKNMDWLNHFNVHKKKDDLGDCFLQGIWYSYKNKLINNCGDT